MKKLLLSLIFAVSLFAGEYVVDKPHTNVSFEIKHLTISLVTGVFNDFSGTFSFDEKKGIPTKINGVIKVVSIDTGTQKRDDHLRTPDFFDAKSYPDIKFKMTGFKGGKVLGELTIKDVTREVAFDYKYGGAVVDPWGNSRIGFGLIGEIDRFDYNVNYDQKFGAGLPSVGSDVKLLINVEGILQK